MLLLGAILFWFILAASAALPPRLLYGTAWKKENTTALVRLALQELNFAGFDTANQKAHYEEALVGEALLLSMASINSEQRTIFSQTKFSFQQFQYDGNLPFSANATITQQVMESLESSLRNLHLKQIDSLLLHGPLYVGKRLAREDLEVYRAMEDLVLSQQQQKVRLLGITNCSPEQFEHLMEIARVKPRIWQTRCLVSGDWSSTVRATAQRLGVQLQCYSVISGNRRVLKHATVQRIVHARSRHQQQAYTAVQVLVRFIHQYFNQAQIITGSSNEAHLREVYSAVYEMEELTPIEMADIARIGMEEDFSGVQVKVSVANEFKNDMVKVFWLKDDGAQERVLNLDILPGGVHVLNTYHDHEFQIVRHPISNGEEEVILLERGKVNAKRGLEQFLRFGLDLSDEL